MLLVAMGASAQIGKHSIVTGLDFNFESGARDYYDSAGKKYPDQSTTSKFSVSPSVGLFLSDKILAGVSATGSWEKADDNFHGYPNAHPKNSSKSLTVFIRHYTMLSERVYFFVQSDVTWAKTVFESLAFNTSTGTIEPYRQGTHSFQAGVRPGIAYFVTPRFALESTVGFAGFTRVYSGNDDFNFQLRNITNTFGANLNSSTLRIGFRFYFARRPMSQAPEH